MVRTLDQKRRCRFFPIIKFILNTVDIGHIMDTIVTRFSDEGVVKFLLKAPREEKFDNGDQIWPRGMLLEIYDEQTTPLIDHYQRRLCLTTINANRSAAEVAAQICDHFGLKPPDGA